MGFGFHHFFQRFDDSCFAGSIREPQQFFLLGGCELSAHVLANQIADLFFLHKLVFAVPFILDAGQRETYY
jgi:hypothetical protein